MSNKKNYDPLFMYKRVRQISHSGRSIKELIKKGPFLNHIASFVAQITLDQTPFSLCRFIRVQHMQTFHLQYLIMEPIQEDPIVAYSTGGLPVEVVQ